MRKSISTNELIANINAMARAVSEAAYRIARRGPPTLAELQRDKAAIQREIDIRERKLHPCSFGQRRYYDEVCFRVWPDGTVQDYDESPYLWMSDDFQVVWAGNEEEALQRAAQ